MSSSAKARPAVPVSIIGSASLSLAVAACASQDLVHFGGTLNPAETPRESLACSGSERHRTIVDRAPPDFPAELAYFMYISQRSGPRQILMRFDIAPDGTTRNIRYGGDLDDLDHGATRDAVQPAARAIATWRYVWNDTAPANYAIGCETRFDFAMPR